MRGLRGPAAVCLLPFLSGGGGRWSWPGRWLLVAGRFKFRRGKGS